MENSYSRIEEYNNLKKEYQRIKNMKVENIYNPWQEPNLSAPQGWVCPKCGRVYSPTTPMCFYCGSEDHITISTTGTQPEWGDRSWAFKGGSKEGSVEK